MATWDDVRRVALALPAVEQGTGHGNQQWSVNGKLLAWERPLRKGDLEALGARAPQGDVLGVRVPDEGVKHALVADDPEVFFTTPHFDGYPAVLVVLAAIGEAELQELVTEAWLDRAPKRMVKEYLAAR